MSVWWSAPHKCWRYKFQIDLKSFSGDIRRSDGTTPPERGGKREARQIEEELKVQKRKEVKAALAVPAGEFTLAEAIVVRLAAAKKKKEGGLRNMRMIKSRQRKILSYFGPDTRITTIRKSDIDGFSTFLIEEEKKVWKGGPHKVPVEQLAEGMKPLKNPAKRSRSTANAILHELSAILRAAHKTEDKLTGRRMLPEMPIIEFFSVGPKVPNPIPDEDIVRILDNAAPHLVDYLSLCRLFGFREQEALHFERSWVRWADGIVVIPAEHAKSGRDEILPISNAAYDFLRTLYDDAAAAGQKQLVLYIDPKTGKKRPLKSVRTAWERACARAKLEVKYRKHGMRGRFITALAETTSPEIVHRLARHLDYETTQGYVEIAANLKRAAINAADAGAGARALEFRRKSRQKTAPDNLRAGAI